MYAKSNLDPELEKLRKEVEGPPNLDTVALSIERATTRIHAAYLFEHIGKLLLRKICLLLSSTATGKIYNGWQEFAAHMGLTMEQIRCIDYDFKGLQDPTYYVLLTYVQNVEATLDRILNALQKMQRFDIINQIKDDVSKFINAVPRNTTVDESVISRPKNVPRAPLVLSPVECMQDTLQHQHTKEHNTQEKSQNKQSYGCIVMLTFAEDGSEAAERIKKVFRSKEPRIGVLVLQEQENYVYSRAEEFIDDCFKQVNFVIPILTQKYMEKISNPRKACIDEHSKLDTKYVKYIYSLLRYEYIRNQCINNRVRCIVPDKDISTVVAAHLHPTFQAWFRESDIDAFVNNILLQKFSK